MKLKKIFAGVAAMVVAATTCASFTASAADSYKAFLMYADHDWLWSNMKAKATGEGYGIEADITKDGTYTVSITKDSVTKNENGDNPQGPNTPSATGAVVFCVDILGILKCDNFNAANEAERGITENGTYSPDDLKVELQSIKQDGKELKFDPNKIIYGNIEDQNTNYRIEILNQYGETIKDPPVEQAEIEWVESLDVTFSISGLGGDTAETGNTGAVGGETNTTSNTNTGVETGLALLGLALAGGAIVLTKKRK